MIKITVGNSVCQAHGLSLKQLNDLRELTSYSINPQSAYFSGGYRSDKRYLMDKRGGFPTGLLYIVEEYLDANDITHQVVDSRALPKPRSAFLTPIWAYPPYSEQEEAAEAATAFKRGIISAPTGVGKSMIAALIINRLQVPTLVVVPSLELKRQLTANLIEIFGSTSVGSLKEKRAIAVENVDALSFNKLEGYDCVIIDEFHHSGAKTYRKLNKMAWSGVYYKFGLTATPFRSQEHERLLLESVLSQVIYRLDYATAVAKGYIVPIEAYYYELPKSPVRGHTWPEVYSELVVNNKPRNQVIAHLLDTLLLYTNSAVLCLVKEINHGLNISKAAQHKHAFVKGENEDNREVILEYLLSYRQTLIGTNGVVGEGVDTKPAEYVIIAGLGKSKNQFMQQVGRGVRVYKGKESCKVILFKDPSHKWTINHFNAQVKYLRQEYGIKPVKLSLTV